MGPALADRLPHYAADPDPTRLSRYLYDARLVKPIRGGTGTYPTDMPGLRDMGGTPAEADALAGLLRRAGE